MDIQTRKKIKWEKNEKNDSNKKKLITVDTKILNISYKKWENVFKYNLLSFS